jgi:serine/threonine protein kinase
VKPTIEGYTILENMPRGGQAIVYKAFQKATKRIVAVKVLLQGAHASARHQYRFEREVKLAASLHHPNIVTIHDSGISEGQYYYVMEYIDGNPLDEYIESKDLSACEIMVLFEKVCSASAYAHQHGVMHRDIKPGNVLVDENGEPHILDFGLAKVVDDPDSESEPTFVSIEGQVIGTLAYMSPEQATGNQDTVDIRTDVYSIGVMLYKVLTGKFPYDVSKAMLATLKNIQQVDPIRPSRLVSSIKSEIEAITMKSLEKDPNRRYQSAAHLQDDIKCWLSGKPISAKSDSSLYLLKKFIFRRPAASITVVLLLIIIVSNSFISTYFLNKSRSVNEILEVTTEGYRKESERNMTFAKQVTLATFLELWFDDKTERANVFAIHLDRSSREGLAARFLLDQRAFDEKIKGFSEALSAKSDQSSFMAFIFGEYYLKNNNKAEAIKAYEQCLRLGEDDSDLDDWFKNRSQRKLDILLEKRLPPKS